MRAGLPLVKNVLTAIAKNVLLHLGVAAAASATDAAIQTKTDGLGIITLINSHEEMKDILEILKYPEESDLLVEGVTFTIENEAKGKKGGFLPLLLNTLGDNLLGNILAGKEVIRAGESSQKTSRGQSATRAVRDF